MIFKSKRGGDPTAVSLFILFLWTVVAFAAPPTIELPKEIKGETISFIKIVAKTDAKKVCWVALDEGISIFPSAELKDERNTVVIAKKDGTYRILAYTGNADGPSLPSICTVIVGTPVPPVPVPPVPPVPKPDDDPLVTDLKKLYAADPKPDMLKKLITVYKEVPGYIESDTTVGTLYAMCRKAADAVMPKDALKSIRERLQKELEKDLPLVENFPLEKEKVKTLFAKIEKALRAVGGE